MVIDDRESERRARTYRAILATTPDGAFALGDSGSRFNGGGGGGRSITAATGIAAAIRRLASRDRNQVTGRLTAACC